MFSDEPVKAMAVATAPKEFANSKANVPRIDGIRIGNATIRQYCKPACAQNFRRLAPFALQPVKGRRDDQDHQRDLEEQIGDRQAPEAEDVEAQQPQIDAQLGAQENGDQARPGQASR